MNEQSQVVIAVLVYLLGVFVFTDILIVKRDFDFNHGDKNRPSNLFIVSMSIFWPLFLVLTAFASPFMSNKK